MADPGYFLTRLQNYDVDQLTAQQLAVLKPYVTEKVSSTEEVKAKSLVSMFTVAHRACSQSAYYTHLTCYSG